MARKRARVTRKATKRKAAKQLSLFEAVGNSDLSLVEVLVKQEDVNAQDAHGNTPLHRAVVKLNEADIGDKLSDAEFNNLPQLGIVLCLAQVADVTMRNHEGKQPVHSLLKKYGLLSKYLCRTSEALEQLITADTVQYKDQDGYSLLYRSLYNKQYGLAELLVKKGADVTALAGKAQMSALHFFAKYCKNPSPELMASLAKHGMLNARDTDGNTALHHAVGNFNLKALRELKRLKADTSIVNTRNRSLIDMYHAVYGFEILHELLKDDIDISVCLYVDALYHAISRNSKITWKRFDGVFSMLTHRIRAGYNLKVLYLAESMNRMDLEINNEKKVYWFRTSKQAQVFCHILCELPVRIHSIPEPLFSPEKHTTPETAQPMRDIDQLWKDYAAMESVLPLSTLYRTVIRRALGPRSGQTVEQLPLPQGLKLFIHQTDVAEHIYGHLTDFRALSQ